MGLAKGGLIESAPQVVGKAPKGIGSPMESLMSTFPFPNDVWADATVPSSPSRPWRILTATDNFKILTQR